MYKILLFTILSVFFIMLHASQVDQELAMQTLFQAKYALNRSTNAAAQQLDVQKLSLGINSIDVDKAQNAAYEYLQKNLNLDSANMPLPHAFLRTKVDVLEFIVINENEQFPFTYTNSAYDYSVVVHNPSVIMIIQVVYPRTYNIIGPITWEIKGAAEVVNILF